MSCPVSGEYFTANAPFRRRVSFFYVFHLPGGRQRPENEGGGVDRHFRGVLAKNTRAPNDEIFGRQLSVRAWDMAPTTPF